MSSTSVGTRQRGLKPQSDKEAVRPRCITDTNATEFEKHNAQIGYSALALEDEGNSHVHILKPYPQ